jgi:hypothetical protein
MATTKRTDEGIYIDEEEAINNQFEGSGKVGEREDDSDASNSNVLENTG